MKQFLRKVVSKFIFYHTVMKHWYIDFVHLFYAGIMNFVLYRKDLIFFVFFFCFVFFALRCSCCHNRLKPERFFSGKAIKIFFKIIMNHCSQEEDRSRRGAPTWPSHQDESTPSDGEGNPGEETERRGWEETSGQHEEGGSAHSSEINSQGLLSAVGSYNHF